MGNYFLDIQCILFLATPFPTNTRVVPRNDISYHYHGQTIIKLILIIMIYTAICIPFYLIFRNTVTV